MLKQLIGKNFRTHEDLDMEFSPFVNVIWGLPGSGKTNILRMIDWIATNKPAFKRVHSHFAKDGETTGELIFDNGSVKLTKNSKSEEFLLNKRKSFSVTNRSIPEPIARLINMGEINFSFQLDQHFLITSTPGDVGKTINRITKIEKIDSWVSKLTTLSNKTKDRIELLESECKVLDKEYHQYDGIEDVEKEINLFNALSEKSEELQERIDHITQCSDRMKILSKRITELQELDMDTRMKELSVLIQTCEQNQDSYMSLESKRQTYRKTLLKKQQLEALIKDIHIEGFEELLQELQDKDKLRYHLQSFAVLSQTLFTKKEKLKVLKAGYINAVIELGTCPICQNTISPKHIKELEMTL